MITGRLRNSNSSAFSPCIRADSTSLEVIGVERNGIVVLQPGFIIVAGLLGSFADVAIIHKGADTDFVSRLFQDFERLSSIGERPDDFRLQCIVPSLNALRAVESIEYFRFDSGPFLILFGNRFRIFTDQTVALQGSAQIGNHDFGIFLGKVRSNLNAVRGGNPGAFAVENLSGKSPEGKKFTERHEIRMRIDLSRL